MTDPERFSSCSFRAASKQRSAEPVDAGHVGAEAGEDHIGEVKLLQIRMKRTFCPVKVTHSLSWWGVGSDRWMRSGGTV